MSDQSVPDITSSDVTADDPESSAFNDSSGKTTSEKIESWRKEIDHLDSLILQSILKRTEISKKVGAARMADGGPRLVHSREVKVIERFNALGPEGHTLAMLLLRLGRGPLGRADNSRQ